MLDIKENLLTTVLAPKEYKEIVLPKRIKEMFANGFAQHELFYGHPGTGKSTLGKILAKKHPNFYMNAARDGGIDSLREGSNLYEFCERNALSFSEDDTDDTFKVVFLDEVNGASNAFFEALKGFMDTYPNVRFIMATNHIEEIPGAVQSRFHKVPFDPINKEEEEECRTKFLKRAENYLKILEFKYDEEGVKALYRKNYPDFRGVLNDLQMLALSGKSEITKDILEQQSMQNTELYDLILHGDLTKPEVVHAELMGKYASKAVDLLWTLDSTFVAYIMKVKPKYTPLVPHLQITLAKHINTIPNFRDPALVLKACVWEMITHTSKIK